MLLLQKRNFAQACTTMGQISGNSNGNGNGTENFKFGNGTEIYKFKAKDSEIVATPLSLGNISKDWWVHNMKKLDLMIMFMISVLIMMLFYLTIF